MPPFPLLDPLLFCPSSGDHLLSLQASHRPLSILSFFCLSSPSLQLCSSAEFITWWPNRAWSSPWSWQASHDGVDDGGGQLGFSICVKEQSSECCAAQSQQAGLHSKILWRLLLAKGRQCFRMQNLGCGLIALCFLTLCPPGPAEVLISPLITPGKSFLLKKMVVLHLYNPTFECQRTSGSPSKHGSGALSCLASVNC